MLGYAKLSMKDIGAVPESNINTGTYHSQDHDLTLFLDNRNYSNS